MNKIKTIKIKNEDGSISEESYTIAADALNIDMVNGKNVQETIGTIDVDKDGDIAAQLNKKINKSDIIDNLDSTDANKVLSAKQGKVLNEAVAAANSDIKKKIYYFNTIADMKAANLQVGDTCQTLGYYKANDGGAGLYKIVNNVLDNNSYILTNGLRAVKISDIDSVRFIFPKFWANAFSGDCNLIKYHNKNILIDCYSPTAGIEGTTTGWNYVKDMLDDNGVSHIDVFICSHYHYDHIGNFENLIQNDYIDETTKLYMPAETTKFGWQSSINHYKSVCTQNNLNYHVPDEYETLIIDSDLKFTFFNCDADILDDYYPEGTGSQNHTSTVVLIEHKSIKALYTGDAQKETLTRIREEKFITGDLDLYKVEHHGINQYTDIDFIYDIKPKYAVQTAGIEDYVKNNFGLCQTMSILENLKTQLYSTFMQDNYIEMVSTGDFIYCKNGQTAKISTEIEEHTLYVDINASKSAIQDGSQEHPFSELMQAITAIETSPTSVVYIKLADGHYCTSHESSARKNSCLMFTGKDTLITIEGNTQDNTAVVIDNMYLYNSYVELKNLSLNIDNTNALYLENSNCILDNVLITSLTQQQNTQNTAIILRRNSSCRIVKAKVDLCRNAIVAYDSNIFIDNLEIGTLANLVLYQLRCNVITNQITFLTNNTYGFNDWYSQTKDDECIFEGKTTGTVNLSKSVANFDWIEINYIDNSNNYGSTGRIYSPNNKYISVSSPHSAQNVIYNKQARFHITGNTITIDNQLQFVYNGSDYEKITTGDMIFITKVIVGYNKYHVI